MKKSLHTLVLATMITMAFAACSSKEGVNSTSQNQNSQWQQAQGERAFKQLDDDVAQLKNR